MHLRLVASSYAPWMNLTRGDKINCSGISCQLVKYLSRSLNFTYEFVFQQDIGTGVQMKNGSWTGALGYIQREEADMTGTPVVMLADPFEQKLIEHVQPFFFEEPAVLTRYDDSWKVGNLDVVNILGTTCWTIFLALFVISIILMVCLDEKFIKKNDTIFQKFSSVSLLMFSILLGKDIQISELLQVKAWTIFLMTSWLFGSFQLSQIISGEITTMFSLKMPNKQINTLEELLDSKMNLVAFSAFMTTINIQNNEVFNRIKQKVEQDHTSISIGQMFANKEWVIDTSLGKTAMLLAQVPLKTITMIHLTHLKKGTKFRFLDERYRQPLLITLATSFRLPEHFRRGLNFRVLQYITTGLVDQELKVVLAKSDRLFDFKESVDANFEEISLEHLFILFKILLVFLTMSIFTFGLEKIFKFLPRTFNKLLRI